MLCYTEHMSKINLIRNLNFNKKLILSFISIYVDHLKEELFNGYFACFGGISE